MQDSSRHHTVLWVNIDKPVESHPFGDGVSSVSPTGEQIPLRCYSIKLEPDADTPPGPDPHPGPDSHPGPDPHFQYTNSRQRILWGGSFLRERLKDCVDPMLLYGDEDNRAADDDEDDEDEDATRLSAPASMTAPAFRWSYPPTTLLQATSSDTSRSDGGVESTVLVKQYNALTLTELAQCYAGTLPKAMEHQMALQYIISSLVANIWLNSAPDQFSKNLYDFGEG